MEVNLATVVLGWDKLLVTADHLLAKGAEHAAANGVSEAEMLDWRLAPDMFPLRRQIQVVCNLVQQWSARPAGLPVPPDATGDADIAQLKQTIAAARDFLAAIRPEQLAGRDNEVLTVDLGQIKPTMPIGQWVLGFAQTNLIFHLSIAYAILRSRGVPLSKPDLFAGGL